MIKNRNSIKHFRKFIELSNSQKDYNPSKVFKLYNKENNCLKMLFTKEQKQRRKVEIDAKNI